VTARESEEEKERVKLKRPQLLTYKWVTGCKKSDSSRQIDGSLCFEKKKRRIF